MSSNIVSISSKRKPIANITEEPVVNRMPKTIAGPWAAALDETFIVPDNYVGWLDVITFRDGIGKVWDGEVEDDEEIVAVVLNNCCRKHLGGGISWRMDRRKYVLEILSVFKNNAYIEFHPGFTGITLIVRGNAEQVGRAFGVYRWIEVLDYRTGKPLPMSGNQLSDWGVPEPPEFQTGLDWLYERFMAPDEFSDEEDLLVDDVIDQIANERNRLLINVENGKTDSVSVLTEEQQLAVYQTLFELLEGTHYFPYTLLDGFIPNGE